MSMKDEANSLRTAPGLEGGQAPFHVLPPPSSGAPAALNSQEDYDAFVRYLRSKIANRLESELDPDVQDAIVGFSRPCAGRHLGFSERFSQDLIVGAESKLAGPLGAKARASPPPENHG